MSAARLRAAATLLYGCAARADAASAALVALVDTDMDANAWTSDHATAVRDELAHGPAPTTARLRAAATVMRTHAVRMDAAAHQAELTYASNMASSHAQEPDRSQTTHTPHDNPIGPPRTVRPTTTRPAGVA